MGPLWGNGWQGGAGKGRVGSGAVGSWLLARLGRVGGGGQAGWGRVGVGWQARWVGGWAGMGLSVLQRLIIQPDRVYVTAG